MIRNIFQEEEETSSIFIYIPDILSSEEVKEYKELVSKIDFVDNYNYNETKVIRKQKWFHHNQEYFCNKWKTKYKRWEGHPYFMKLQELQDNILSRVHEKVGDDVSIPEINSCLIQHYENGRSYIRDHRDTDKSFGKEPVILGLSLGAKRTLEFKSVMYSGSNRNLSKRNKTKSHLNFSFSLEEGSIFIMAGSSQKFWTHGSPKEETDKERYSLTFRKTI